MKIVFWIAVGAAAFWALRRLATINARRLSAKIEEQLAEILLRKQWA